MGVFRGGGLRLPSHPLSADPNFYDFFATSLFFLPEHQNLGIH